MSRFRNSRWDNLSEFEEKNGFIYIKMDGKIISEKSNINKIYFEEDAERHLEIFGDYSIVIRSDKLKMLELTEEMNDYFSDFIKGRQVKFIRFDRRGNLEIFIDSDPILKIEMNVDECQFFGDKWQYNYNGGFIVFS